MKFLKSKKSFTLIWLGLICTTFIQSGKAQINFSVNPYQTFVLKASDNLAFWIYTNQQGLVNPFSNQLITGLDNSIIYPITKSIHINAYSNVAFSTNFGFVAQDYGITLNLNSFKVGFGTENQDIGSLNRPLSTGSFVISGNAKPFEKLFFSTNGFIPFPFVGEYGKYFLINGYVSHTKFKSRDVNDEMLHFKSLYGHLFKDFAVSIYGGIAHMAFWGGNTPEFGQLANSWKDFYKIFWAIGGGEVGPDAEKAYTLGNHIGVFDFAILYKDEQVNLDFYRTFLIEDRDGLNFKNLWEGAFGVILTQNDKSILKTINYEYIYTKRQSGSLGPPINNERGGSGGRDNYYNHYIYTNGWTNNGYTIGNPLLTSSLIKNYGNFSVSNNRVVAHHIGLESALRDDLNMKTVFTYSRNYGTYFGKEQAEFLNQKYFFENGPRQWSVGVFIEKKIGSFYNVPLQLSLALASDFGAMYETQISSLVTLKMYLQHSINRR